MTITLNPISFRFGQRVSDAQNRRHYMQTIQKGHAAVIEAAGVVAGVDEVTGVTPHTITTRNNQTGKFSRFRRSDGGSKVRNDQRRIQLFNFQPGKKQQ